MGQAGDVLSKVCDEMALRSSPFFPLNDIVMNKMMMEETKREAVSPGTDTKLRSYLKYTSVETRS